MIYAIRHDGDYRTLIELLSEKHLQPNMQHVRPTYAHKWVRDMKPHETGLWIDEDDQLRYSRPQS